MGVTNEGTLAEPRAGEDVKQLGVTGPEAGGQSALWEWSLVTRGCSHLATALTLGRLAQEQGSRLTCNSWEQPDARRGAGLSLHTAKTSFTAPGLSGSPEKRSQRLQDPPKDRTGVAGGSHVGRACQSRAPGSFGGDGTVGHVCCCSDAGEVYKTVHHN